MSHTLTPGEDGANTPAMTTTEAPPRPASAASNASRSPFDLAEPTTSPSHEPPASSSDEHSTTNPNSNRDSMAILGGPNSTPGIDDGLNMYASEDTRRRFFGHIGPGDGFTRESVVSGTSSPGLRGSYAGALYDSDDGSAVGFAPPPQPTEDRDVGAGFLPSSGFATGAGGVGANTEPNRDNVLQTTSSPTHPGLVEAGVGSRLVEEKAGGDVGPDGAVDADELGRGRDRMSRRRRRLILAGALAGLIVLALVIALPVALTRNKGHGSNNTSNPGGGNGGGGGGGNGGGGGGGGGGTPPPPPPSVPTTGGDGSTVTTDKNTTFTYSNSFGGFWVEDPDDPFNMNAQAQSWVPPLNQSWDWSKYRAFGVNLGGWLVLEPFITPSYYEKYPTARDEWTLSEALAADPNSGGLETFLTNHYDTFITEEDFAKIAGAGLSWVRIPLPFWAIETRGDEPFLPKVSWTYFLKAVHWARKYGIRINLDLHTLPGSQNGFNHSGRQGLINFLNDYMGIANAQRALEYIRVITEFISQPEYSHVALWSIANEARTAVIGKDIVSHFYLEMHDMVRNITGFGADHGPYIAIHDGFQGASSWAGFMEGADRLVLDSHPYLCFGDQDTSPLSEQIDKPCQYWGESFNGSLSNFGVTVAGEWSVSWNDCGYWLNGARSGSRWAGTFTGYSGPTGGSCDPWTDWQNYTSTTKKQLYSLAQASMDALPHWFFWTWKIGNSSITGTIEAPAWSYSLGLDQGWIPKDPRSSVGTCKAAGVNDPFDGTFSAYQTGGKGAGTIAPTFVAEFGDWPPSSLSGVDNVAYAPTYTATGAVPTLSPPVYTLKNGTQVSGGSGWYNAADTAGAPTNITGCNYPDPWAQTVIPEPTTICGGGGGDRRRAPMPMRTEPPIAR